MCKYPRLWFVAATLATASSAWSEQPPSQITNLVQKLASVKFSDRDYAARELKRIGEPALKPLQSALESRDLELRSRAKVLIESIEARMVNEKLIRASTISLKFANKPLDEALAEVNKKTGLSLSLHPICRTSPKQLVNVDTGEVPLWEAVERFLAAVGLVETDVPLVTETPNTGKLKEQKLGIVSWPPQENAPSIDYKIKLTDGQVAASRNSTILRVRALPKDFPGNTRANGSNEINLQLDVMPVPTIKWQGVLNVDIRRAVDERGISIAQSHLGGNPQLAEDSPFLPMWGGQPMKIRVMMAQGMGVRQVVQFDGSFPTPATTNPRHVSIKLLSKDSSAKVLRELEGIITAEIQTPPQPIITVDHLATIGPNTSFREGNYRLQLSQLKTNSSELKWYVKLEMPLEHHGLAQQQIFGGWTPIGPQLTVTDPKDKPIKSVKQNLVEQSFDGTNQIMGYELVVPLKGMKPEELGAKLVLIGSQIVNIDVPFSLKNVALP